jgi:hypothetical protein
MMNEKQSLRKRFEICLPLAWIAKSKPKTGKMPQNLPDLAIRQSKKGISKHSLRGFTGFEEQEAVRVSLWMLSLRDELGPEQRTPQVNPLGIKVTLIEPGAVGTDMQSEYSPQEQRQKEEKMEMLKAEDIAAWILYAITQPKRCDVVTMQIRPPSEHMIQSCTQGATRELIRPPQGRAIKIGIKKILPCQRGYIRH